jgi:hypothetical protein
MSDPRSDRSLEHALGSAPADLWDRLFEAARGFLAEPEHTTWGGGEQVGTTMVDGEERRVFQMPYAVYSEEVDQIVKLFYEIGIVQPFDWARWDGVELYRGRTTVDP